MRFLLFLIFCPLCLLAAPRFIGADRYGVRPGHELQWRIAVHDVERVEALSLPTGLTFDAEIKTVRGRLDTPGRYPLTLRATTGDTSVEETFVVEVGEAICLSPPMGWNSWYSYSEAVSQEGIVSVAELLEASGLADAGWVYVNIDDCWQGERLPGGALQPNEKFPDMKLLCDQLHARGLKVGLYSTPWISTYAGFRGSSSDANEDRLLPPAERLQAGQVYGRYPGLHRNQVDHIGTHWHFDIDAKQWARWGFDYVKVDWKPNDIPTTARIAKDLRASGRDIVLSLSNDAPIANAAGLARHANLWRTTPDIQDTWWSIKSIGRAQLHWLAHQSAGHWNDPDILQIGNIGTPNQKNLTFRPTRLTPREQHYQMTLWCFLGAPLLISSDLAHLSPETKALLTDPELLLLNQRYGALPITIEQRTDAYFVLSKHLPHQNTTLYALFNDSDHPQTIHHTTFTHTLAPHEARLIPYTTRDNNASQR